MAIPFTKDQLGQTIRKGVDESGNPIGQIIGQPALSPQEYAMMNTRADVERGAQMERPIYGMWDGNTFVSTDPNEIAEINARAEMKRTGLDRYYRPQSGPYFEAFNKIRDRYLQQELGKKAAMEAEGRGIVANRLGAFDKILQERAEAVKNSGLNALREAQAKEALAKAKSYEEGGGTPAQQRQEAERMRSNLISEAIRRLADYEKIEKDYGTLPPEQRPQNYNDIMKAKKTAYATIEYLIGGGDPSKVHFVDTGLLGRMTDEQGRYNVGAQSPTIKAPVAQGVGSSGVVRKYNSHEEVLSALKGVDAGTAVQILRANNMTVEDLRKIGQPKTNYPKTQEVAKKKRPHEMTPEELNKADVEYWNKWKTATGTISPLAPKSPGEQAAEFNKAVEYNRQLAEQARARNLFGQR